MVRPNPTSRDRFLLEAEITGALEHPGIVPVYGLGMDLDALRGRADFRVLLAEVSAGKGAAN
jgi:hypothetical protein